MRERGIASQTELSDKTGIDRSQINRLIRGRAKPTASDIGYLAEVLGCSAEDLLAGVEVSAAVRKAINHAAELEVRRAPALLHCSDRIEDSAHLQVVSDE